MLKRNGLLAAILLSGALFLPQKAMAENTITWASPLSYRNLDPAVAFGAETYILGNIYETLFLYDNGEVKPRLAVSWEKSDGGKTWTVTLRDGVKFHDGSPLDAAAVKKSFEYTRDLGRGAGYLYADLETVETPDNRTAVFKFSKPIAFDLIASGQYGSYVIGPAAIDNGTEWMDAGNAVGTGPYMLTDYEPNELTVITKFDDYWGGWEPGQIDRVIHPVVSEASTRVQMVRSGGADVVRAPVSQLAALDALPNVSVAASSGWRNYIYLFNFKKYPTDNSKFREGLIHLWDHESVLQGIFQGYATRAVAPVPHTMWGHGDYDMGSFDLDEALRLFEESGVPREDWKIDVMYSNSNQEQIDAIELFQAVAAQIGLQVELRPEASKTYVTKARGANTAANMHSVVWYPAYPTPSDWLQSLFKSRTESVGWNLSRYKNPEFDDALAAAVDMEGIDVDASAEAYIAAQDILMQDKPAIFYADVDRVFVHASDLKGMENSSNPAYETLFIYALSK